MFPVYVVINLLTLSLAILPIPVNVAAETTFGVNNNYRSVSVKGDQIINVPVKLSRPATSAFMVIIQTSGSATSMDTPAYRGTIKGSTPAVCGPHYTLSSREISFKRGEESKMITVTIKDRKTPDGLHIPDIPKQLVLTLINKVTGSPVLPQSIMINIVDGTVKTIIDVKKNFGAKGDGLTDDTAAINKAIDMARASVINPDVDQAIVYFSPGTYLINSNVKFYAGVSLIGDSPATTRIKRHDEAWYLKNAKSSKDGRWWIVMINAISFSSNNDSALTGIRNITIDGNRPGLPITEKITDWTQHRANVWEAPSKLKGSRALIVNGKRQIFKHSLSEVTGPGMAHYDPQKNLLYVYSTTDLNQSTVHNNFYTKWEPSPNMFVSANPAKAGRLRLLFENMMFEDSAAAGLSINDNIDVRVFNSRFHNCLTDKNGLVLVGGYTRTRIDQVTFDGLESPCGIHIELNSAVGGYFKDGRTDFEIKNSYLNSSFDIGGGSTGHAIFTIRNCLFDSVKGKSSTISQLWGGAGTITVAIHDSIISLQKSGQGYFGIKDNSSCKWYAENTTFKAVNLGGGRVTSGPFFYPWGRHQKFQAHLYKCRFDRNGQSDPLGVIGIYGQFWDKDLQNVWLENCTVDADTSIANLGMATASDVGGGFKATNCEFKNAGQYLFKLMNNSKSGALRPLRCEISGAQTKFTNCSGAFGFLQLAPTFGPANTWFNFTGINLPVGSPLINIHSYNSELANVPPGNYGHYPQRTYRGNQPPNVNPWVQGLVNDKYINSSNGDVYKAEAPTFSATSLRTGTWTKQ